MKRRIVVLLVSIMLISLTGCGLLGNSEIAEVSEQGMKALERGNYEDALDSFDRALDLGAKREETEELYEILKDFLAAKKAYEEKDYRGAEHYLDELDDEYKEYDTLRRDVRDFKDLVDTALDEQSKANTKAAEQAADDAKHAAADAKAAAQAAQNQASAPVNSYSDGYLFPSDTDYLTVSYLNTLDKHTIDLIRNEIYARHGYIFQTAEFANYFNAQSWYIPSVPAANFNTSVFNSVERANLDLLIEYQGL